MLLSFVKMYSRGIVVILSVLFVVNEILIVEAPIQITLEKTTVANGYTYVVSIRNSKVRQHFCGGALISDRHVLSAGHCLYKHRNGPDNVYISLGIYNRIDEGVRRNIKRITIHPEFNLTSLHNDLSIITTYNKIHFNDQIQPIALPQTDHPQNGNLKAVAMGWGRPVRYQIFKR